MGASHHVGALPAPTVPHNEVVVAAQACNKSLFPTDHSFAAIIVVHGPSHHTPLSILRPPRLPDTAWVPHIMSAHSQHCRCLTMMPSLQHRLAANLCSLRTTPLQQRQFHSPHCGGTHPSHATPTTFHKYHRSESTTPLVARHNLLAAHTLS